MSQAKVVPRKKKGGGKSICVSREAPDGHRDTKTTNEVRIDLG